MAIEITQPQKILIVRLSAHGDVVQTLPLLAAIKANNPLHQVSWLVETSAAPLLENHPLLYKLHCCPRKTWFQRLKTSPTHWFQVLKEVQNFIKTIRTENYTLAFDVQGLLKSAIWPWLARIPVRVGYSHTRENAAFFYNRWLTYHDLTDERLPAPQKFMEFVSVLEPSGQKTPLSSRPILFPLPSLLPEVSDRVRGLLTPLNFLQDDKKTLVIAPTTQWDSKTWPISHWQTLLTAIEPWKIQVIFIGGPDDQDWVSQSWPHRPLPPHWLNLMGKTQWPDLYALFQQCEVFIGMDSAPLHIANAVAANMASDSQQLKILGLFGPTAPGRTGPIGLQHETIQTKLSCQPCFKRQCPLKTDQCMTDLSAEAVISRLEGLLNSSK